MKDAGRVFDTPYLVHVKKMFPLAKEHLKYKYSWKSNIKTNSEFEFISSDSFFPNMYFKIMKVMIKEDQGKVVMEMKPWSQKASLNELLQWRMLFPSRVQMEVFTIRIVS